MLEDHAYMEGLNPRFTASAYRGLPTIARFDFFRFQHNGKPKVARYYRDAAGNRQTYIWDLIEV
jgi:hypothetical protein